MGEIKQIKITNFNGSIATDKRVRSGSKFAITSHFDAFTYPKKLVPYVKTEAIVDSNAFWITKFLYAAQRNSSTFYIYGFGTNTDNATGKIRVYRMSSGDTSWGNSNNNISGLDKKEGMFFYYKGYIYMWGGTNKLIRYDTSGSDAFNDSYQTVTVFSTSAQAVLHPADDIVYMFTDNIVHTLNDTSWSEAALTLPDNLKIVDATPYGNYLAIACITKGSAEEKSVVYLWDRDSSLTTISDIIDFGSGKIKYIATLNNRLTAVMFYYLSSLLAQNRPKIIIKQASGSFGKTINEIEGDDEIATSIVTTTKFIEGDKLYFPVSIPLGNDTRNGIWVVNSDGRLTLDTVEELVASASIKRYDGIIKLGNQWTIAHSGDGSISRTDDGNAFSSTLSSIYESLIFNGGDSDWQKKLIGITVMTEPLPAAGKIILKYRKDEDIDGGSWTTIFTEDTNDSISFDAINISGATLPEFKEIQFQINSTGGAVIIGFKFKYEITKRGALY